ncbi:MAG: hypothetical protein NXI16_06145 [Alphaproteobacteria bacterium]|nr:hypothetical protein [Alphaproteobacteria bacterium]
MKSFWRCFLFVLFVMKAALASGADPVATSDALYRGLNMRTLPSAFGPVLKYYCHLDYLSDFVARGYYYTKKSSHSFIVDNGEWYFYFNIIKPDKIRVAFVAIRGTARRDDIFRIVYDPVRQEWRSDSDYYTAKPDICGESLGYHVPETPIWRSTSDLGG